MTSNDVTSFLEVADELGLAGVVHQLLVEDHGVAALERRDLADVRQDVAGMNPAPA